MIYQFFFTNRYPKSQQLHLPKSLTCITLPTHYHGNQILRKQGDKQMRVT